MEGCIQMMSAGTGLCGFAVVPRNDSAQLLFPLNLTFVGWLAPTEIYLERKSLKIKGERAEFGEKDIRRRSCSGRKVVEINGE